MARAMNDTLAAGQLLWISADEENKTMTWRHARRTPCPRAPYTTQEPFSGAPLTSTGAPLGDSSPDPSTAATA